MTAPGAWLRGLATDLKIAVLFSTRVPLVHVAPISGAGLARATWALPIAGALVGAIGALVYWVAFRLRLPPLPAAGLALTATLLATGCLHEDGLADTADGLGGGDSREQRLAIMRDSRLGTYGACALVISLILRWSVLASIADPPTVAMVLIAAHASARAMLPAFMRYVPQARPDGLSADAGRPPREAVAAAGLLGLLALGLGLDPMIALVGLVLLLLAGVLMAWLSRKLIGGQTGDVLGAVEQIGEVLVLLAAVALLKAEVQA